LEFILLPETLLQCISETHDLLVAIGQIVQLLEETDAPVEERVQSRLMPSTQTLFKAFPAFLQEELCTQVRSDGRVDLTHVSTEQLILSMVESELDRRRRCGWSIAFKGSCHELTYQGRSSMATNFDCDLAYSLGYTSGICVDGGRNGYLVHASNLKRPRKHWSLGAIPLSSCVTIGKKGVGMESVTNARWNKSVLARLPHPLHRMCINPGPIQFSLERDVALTLSESNVTAQLSEVSQLMAELQSIAATAADNRTVEMVAGILENGVRVLHTFKDCAE